MESISGMVAGVGVDSRCWGWGRCWILVLERAGVGDGAVLELEGRCLGSCMKLSAGIGDGWN